MDNYIPPRRRARRSPRQRHLPAQIRCPETVWKRRCCAPARRTLQSGTWILFQGEVKFLTGGDPIDDGSDARRRASGGRRRSAVRDPEAFRSGDRCQTRLEREGAIRGNPKADSGGNPGPTVTVRMEEAEIRNEARAHRQLAMDAAGANRHGAASCAQDLRTPRACMERNPYGLVFFCRPEDAPPIEDLRERGSP